MAIGNQYTVRLHADATNNVVLDGIDVSTFTHDASFGTAIVTNIKIGDHPGTTNFDSFDVRFSYPAGYITPPNSLTVNALVQAAVSAINTEIVSGPRIGGGGPSVDIATLGTIVPGSGYTPGTYPYVRLNGGTGTGAYASIVVNVDGTVHPGGVTLVAKGTGYTALDVLTVKASDLGGVTSAGIVTGSGFSVPVATVASPITNTTYI